MTAANLRAQLLALLEDGPHTLQALAGWVELSEQAVDRELGVMARLGLAAHVADGWRLNPNGSQDPPYSGQRFAVGKHARDAKEFVPAIGRNRADHRGGRQPHTAAADLLAQVLAIEESSPAPAVCASCGKRFTPLRVEAFCSTDCERLGPPPAVVTRVIDGVEFVCSSVGSRPVESPGQPGPIEAKPQGSSLSGLYGVSKWE